MKTKFTQYISILKTLKILNHEKGFSFLSVQNRKHAFVFAGDFAIFIKNLPQDYILTERQQANLAMVMQNSHVIPRFMMWQALQHRPSVVLSLNDQIVNIMVDTILEVGDCPEDCEMLKAYLFIEQKEQKMNWLKQNEFVG